jgi:hypothetical protein
MTQDDRVAILKAMQESGRLQIVGLSFSDEAPIPYTLTEKGLEAVKGAN